MQASRGLDADAEGCQVCPTPMSTCDRFSHCSHCHCAAHRPSIRTPDRRARAGAGGRGRDSVHARDATIISVSMLHVMQIVHSCRGSLLFNRDAPVELTTETQLHRLLIEWNAAQVRLCMHALLHLGYDIRFPRASTTRLRVRPMESPCRNTTHTPTSPGV